MIGAKKGDWVQVQSVVLPAGRRAPQIPEDTRACDLTMWVKGFAQSDAEEGAELEVLPVTGRREKGILCAVNPGYIHSYGKFIPELLQIQTQLRELMAGEGGDVE